MSDRRRDRIRLEISREAARLFWEQGVAATSGEQIADAVGLSVRTLWRYFRNKESCAEPVVFEGIDDRLAMLRRWPRDVSLEQHFAAELRQRRRRRDARQLADDLLSVRMVGLADTEPDIRAAWLTATDRVERELVVIFADRLGKPPHDLTIRTYAAVSAAAMRVLDEDVSRTLLAGDVDHVNAGLLARRIARAVHRATGGAIGEPVGKRRAAAIKRGEPS